MVFHCIFLKKKAIIITSKHSTRIFFRIRILFYETFAKKCPWRVYWTFGLNWTNEKAHLYLLSHIGADQRHEGSSEKS